MSKKSFKVSKSLYLNPINLATILDPQDGELAIDINDSNKLKKYSTTSSTWVEVGSGGGGGASALNDLTDVTISSVQDGQILVYNSATSQWENQTIVVEETVTEVTILNNQSTPVNTGITFLYPAVKSFELFGHIIRTTSTGEKSEAIKILGIYHTSTSSWEITDTAVGNSGVVFSITAGGNLQYTSDNMSGVSYVGVFKYGYKANGGDKNFVSSALVTQPDSYLQMNGFSVAAGSTGTKILSLASPTYMKSEGNAIKYVKDSVNGDYIEALLDGQYSLGFNYDSSLASTTNSGLGFSKNSNQLTTDFQSINPEHQLAMSYTLDVPRISWVGALKSGDKVRIHSSGGHLASAGTVYSQFSVSYQGSTKILNPSSDQKVDIPTHELRFEGASSRGSTDTAIVKFDTLAKIKGDGFTVVNTAANGTVVTIKKAGKLDVTTSFGLTANSNCYLTKNSTQLTGQPTIASNIMGFSSSEANALQFVNMNWSGEVNVGDIIRVHATANPSNSSSSLNLVLQEKSVAVALQNVAPRWDDSDSAVRVQTSAGFGSTNTQVRRFSSVVDNLGSAIEYVPSPTLGDSFLIKENGLYNISYTDNSTNQANLKITRNQTDQTNNSNILADGYVPAGGNIQTISTQVQLIKGDVIRAVGNGQITSASESKFSISKVGKTQGTVDVTPFVQIPQLTQDTFVSQTANGFGSTATTYYRWSNPIRNTNNGVLQWVSDSVNGDYLKALTDCTVTGSLNANFGTTSPYTHVTVWNSSLTSQIYAASTIQGYSASGTQEWSNPFNVKLNAGEIIRFSFSGTTPTFAKLSVIATASSSSIISQTDQVSSDTISLAFKPTAIVDSDPVGTFNTYLYTANTNNAVIQSTAPTQTVADMNVNGIRVYARPFNSAGTVGLPARVDIKIGKGLKNFRLLGYANTGKTGDFSFDRIVVSSTDERGLSYSYSEATGILSLNAGSCYMSSTTTRYIDAFAGLTNGYFVFNASKTPSLVSVPNLQQRVATISDIKLNTDGGSSVSGVQTRTLNNLVDNTGIVTSLAANQFTLPAGTYYFQASAPAYVVFRHYIKLRNITDNTDSIIGTAEYNAPFSGASGYAQTRSFLMGEITITQSKTFAIQHYTQSAIAGNGLGVSTAIVGGSDVYTQVKITKIK